MCGTAVRAQCEKSRGAAPSPPAEPACLTSLDHSETSSHPLALQSRVQHALHGRTWSERAAVIEALWTSGEETLVKRARRLGWCSFSARVYVNANGSAGLYPDRCKDRLCPTCGGYRAFQLRKKTEAALAGADSVRFVTLTLRHSEIPLAESLRRIRAAFSKVRRCGWWRERVKGGIYGVEVKRNPGSGNWHVHLHALVLGDYMDQAALSRVWEAATDGSPIVDIRAVHSRKSAVKYIAAYVTKGSSVADWPPDAVQEFAHAMHGQRLLQTFGCLHGVAVDLNQDEERSDGTVAVVDLLAVSVGIGLDDPNAIMVATALMLLDDRVAQLLDEMHPTTRWEAYAIRADPLAWLAAYVADPPPRQRNANGIRRPPMLWAD